MTLVDGKSLDDGFIIDVAVCIVGSGPSATGLCESLKSLGADLLVVERGDLSDNTADEFPVTGSGIKIKPESRPEVVGGASTVWSGLSAPLDSSDFSSNKLPDRAAWPLSHSELEQHYKSASEIFGFYDFHNVGRTKTRDHSLLSKLESSVLESKIFAANDPPIFFADHLLKIEKSSGIRLLTNASVTRLNAERSESIVDSAEIVTATGHQGTIKAKIFVLAAGGLGNVKLLLNSPTANGHSLGDSNGHLGKFITNHPKINRGVVHLDSNEDYDEQLFGSLSNGYAKFSGLRLNRQVFEDEDLLNPYIRIFPVFSWSDNPGVRQLVKTMKFLKARYRFSKNVVNKRKLVLLERSEAEDSAEILNWSGLLSIVRNLGQVTRYLSSRALNRTPVPKYLQLRNFIEMESRIENYVELSNNKDRFGMRQILVNVSLSKKDRGSLQRLHDALDNQLQNERIGKLTSEPMLSVLDSQVEEASHYLGGTLCGTDSNFGVADRHLRLHEASNTYLAGGSIFPVAGNANPTFTMVAISLWLGEKILSNLREIRKEPLETTPRSLEA